MNASELSALQYARLLRHPPLKRAVVRYFRTVEYVDRDRLPRQVLKDEFDVQNLRGVLFDIFAEHCYKAVRALKREGRVKETEAKKVALIK